MQALKGFVEQIAQFVVQVEKDPVGSALSYEAAFAMQRVKEIYLRCGVNYRPQVLLIKWLAGGADLPTRADLFIPQIEVMIRRVNILVPAAQPNVRKAFKGLDKITTLVRAVIVLHQHLELRNGVGLPSILQLENSLTDPQFLAAAKHNPEKRQILQELDGLGLALEKCATANAQNVDLVKRCRFLFFFIQVFQVSEGIWQDKGYHGVAFLFWLRHKHPHVFSLSIVAGVAALKHLALNYVARVFSNSPKHSYLILPVFSEDISESSEVERFLNEEPYEFVKEHITVLPAYPFKAWPKRIDEHEAFHSILAERGKVRAYVLANFKWMGQTPYCITKENTRDLYVIHVVTAPAQVNSHRFAHRPADGQCELLDKKRPLQASLSGLLHQLYPNCNLTSVSTQYRSHNEAWVQGFDPTPLLASELNRAISYEGADPKDLDPCYSLLDEFYRAHGDNRIYHDPPYNVLEAFAEILRHYLKGGECLDKHLKSIESLLEIEKLSQNRLLELKGFVRFLKIYISIKEIERALEESNSHSTAKIFTQIHKLQQKILTPRFLAYSHTDFWRYIVLRAAIRLPYLIELMLARKTLPSEQLKQLHFVADLLTTASIRYDLFKDAYHGPALLFYIWKRHPEIFDNPIRGERKKFFARIASLDYLQQYKDVEKPKYLIVPNFLAVHTAFLIYRPTQNRQPCMAVKVVEESLEIEGGSERRFDVFGSLKSAYPSLLEWPSRPPYPIHSDITLRNPPLESLTYFHPEGLTDTALLHKTFEREVPYCIVSGDFLNTYVVIVNRGDKIKQHLIEYNPYNGAIRLVKEDKEGTLLELLQMLYPGREMVPVPRQSENQVFLSPNPQRNARPDFEDPL